VVELPPNSNHLLPLLRATTTRPTAPARRRTRAKGDGKGAEGPAVAAADDEPNPHEAFLVRTLAEVIARHARAGDVADGRTDGRIASGLGSGRAKRFDWRSAATFNIELCFLAQSIAQEFMGAGLHYEPWAQVIAAYRRVQGDLAETAKPSPTTVPASTSELTSELTSAPIPATTPAPQRLLNFRS
jgi:hypothetical protein